MMESLINNLYTNNVIFSYYGFMDSSVLNTILSITKTKLKANGESITTTMRVYNAINECVENIIKHNFFPSEDILPYKSFLLISKKENGYKIDTINVINEEQKKAIKNQMDFMTTKSKEELKTLKAEIIANKTYSKVATAGLGLVDMYIKTDVCEYKINSHNNNYLFNINFNINSKNYASA